MLQSEYNFCSRFSWFLQICKVSYLSIIIFYYIPIFDEYPCKKQLFLNKFLKNTLSNGNKKKRLLLKL